MKFGMVVAVLAVLLCACGSAQAAGLQLPVEGATAVWIQPLEASPGSMGAALSLTLPERIVGETVAEWIKFEIIVHPEAGQVRVDPGVSLSLKSDVGIPVKVGIVLLPLTDYKIGWFVGAEIYSAPF